MTAKAIYERGLVTLFFKENEETLKCMQLLEEEDWRFKDQAIKMEFCNVRLEVCKYTNIDEEILLKVVENNVQS